MRHFFQSAIRVSNISTFFVRRQPLPPVYQCAQNFVHVCAFASGPLRYNQQELFVRISRENFTAACVMSYRFASFYCTSPCGCIFLGRSGVAGGSLSLSLFSLSFFSVLFFIVSIFSRGLHKNDRFRPSISQDGSLVSTCASYPFLIFHVTFLFDVLTPREKGKRCSNSNVRDSELVTRSPSHWRCSFDDHFETLVLAPRRAAPYFHAIVVTLFVTSSVSCFLLVKENLVSSLAIVENSMQSRCNCVIKFESFIDHKSRRRLRLKKSGLVE